MFPRYFKSLLQISLKIPSLKNQPHVLATTGYQDSIYLMPCVFCAYFKSRFSPNDQWSLGPMIPTDLWYHGPVFWEPDVSIVLYCIFGVLCFQGLTFPGSFISSVICMQGSYIPYILCIQVLICLGYHLRLLYSQCIMYHRVLYIMNFRFHGLCAMSYYITVLCSQGPLIPVCFTVNPRISYTMGFLFPGTDMYRSYVLRALHSQEPLFPVYSVSEGLIYHGLHVPRDIPRDLCFQGVMYPKFLYTMGFIFKGSLRVQQC